MTTSMTVGLVMRDRLYRAGLAELLRGTRFEPSYMASTLDDMMNEHSETRPDLIILDIEGTGTSVSDAVETLRGWAPEARLVVVAPRQAAQSLLEAFRAGADGTIHRDVSADAFLDSLALVIAGEPVYPAFLLNEMLSGRQHQQDESPKVSESGAMARLSEREKAVIRDLTEGLSNKDMALRLGISEATVKVHMRRICRVIQAKNRTQAALWGHQHLVKPADAGAESEESAPRSTQPPSLRQVNRS